MMDSHLSTEHELRSEEARIRALISMGPPGAMKKRSVIIDGHRTSVSLENAFWSGLKKMAAKKGITVNQLVTEIDRDRDGNLSSAIRVHILLWWCPDIGAEDTELTARSIQ